MAENASRKEKTVGDPNAQYASLAPLWARCRAIISGERYAKEYDSSYAYTKNLLIPFSPSMTPAQYDFYKKEAELPGIVSLFTKTLTGGLLRKQPILEIPGDENKEIAKWLLHDIGQDGAGLTAFLDNAIYEELQTSRAWIYVDYPKVSEEELLQLTPEDVRKIKPYLVLWKAEHVINWRVTKNKFGKNMLDRLITREFVEKYSETDEMNFHPGLIDTVKVHELDAAGNYQIRVFERRDETKQAPTVSGNVLSPTGSVAYTLMETIQVLAHGEPVRIIPAWPLNGTIDPIEPIMSQLVDKEVALYNKMSRRNHLLYGASTYTPILFTDMTDEEFNATVSAGLGTWMRLRPGEEAKVLDTPTAALIDMDRAIASSIEEMAKLGIRMLSPETAQSGVALDIRNASQTAQLGTTNTKISNTLKQVFAFMIWWKDETDIDAGDLMFTLSSDFSPTPTGVDWMRLATEWYQSGLIPRSVWLSMAKHNDLIDPDYDDDKGKQEITEDVGNDFAQKQDSYTQQMDLQSALGDSSADNRN